MRFTEREMTVAVEAVARRLFEATPKLLRRRSGATSWEDLTQAGRYRHLTAAGDLVLTGLVALPERPTVGAAPEFTDEEYADAAEEAARSRSDREQPGSWDAAPERRRRRELAVQVSLLRAAVAAMPPRQDPDALIIPEHL